MQVVERIRDSTRKPRLIEWPAVYLGLIAFVSDMMGKRVGWDGVKGKGIINASFLR